METALVVLAILAVLAYLSVEYKNVQNGLPVLMMGVSIFGVVFQELGYFTERLMLIIFAIHGVGIGVLIVFNNT